MIGRWWDSLSTFVHGFYGYQIIDRTQRDTNMAMCMHAVVGSLLLRLDGLAKDLA